MNAHSNEIFGLRLSGEQHWQIMGEGQQRSLVSRLAQLMCLTPDPEFSGKRKLIFTDAAKEKAETSENIICAFDNKYIRVYWKPEQNEARVEILDCHDRISQYTIMRIGMQMIQHVNVLQGGFPVHAALIELKGSGMLLIGPGRVGKSTCCRRLPEYWNVFGDDEALIVNNNSKYVAHPFPTWNHYAKYGEGPVSQTESAVPVHMVFFLEQAEKNELVSMPQSEIALRFYASVNPGYRILWKEGRQFMRIQLNSLLFHNACNMVQHVRAFLLKVSLQGQFWENIERMVM